LNLRNASYGKSFENSIWRIWHSGTF
jgi:hypothetical protein